MKFDFSTNEPPDIFRDKRFDYLDGFRAFSIIAVVFGHIYFNENNILASYFSGDWGVEFFFVISGFLITTLLLKEKKKTSTISLKKFYIRRFLRIFPVAYLFLLILFLLSFVFHTDITPNSFYSSLLYVRNLPIFKSHDWYTAHFWSLSVEEQFYLLSPWLIRKNIKIYVIVAISLVITIPILAFYVCHSNDNSFMLFFINKLVVNQTAILIGSLLSIFSYFNYIRIPKMSSFILLLLLLFSIFIKSNTLEFIPSVITPHISALLLSVLIIASLQKKLKSWFYWVFNNFIIVKIGILSYSIYIWQQIFTNYQMWRNLGIYFQSTTLNLLALIVVSMISYYLYEKYFLKIKTKFS